MRQFTKMLAFTAVALLAAGCSIKSKTPPAAQTQKGVAGQYYFVNLFTAPVGGIVTSSSGGIECGASAVAVNNSVTPPQYAPVYYPTASGTANKCGQTKFLWAQTVVLTATPQGGNVFYGWAGDCQGTGTCTLGAGADHTVVAIFGAAGGGHTNISDPALHGQAFFAFKAGAQGALQCTACHGVNLTGQGISPSCNTCHVRAGFADWKNDCTFCHASPPAAPHVQSDGCGGCHTGYSKLTANTGTVNALTHMNGRVDVALASCTSCHGSAANAAPPADVAGHTATTFRGVGAHQAHVASTLTAPIACSECHGAAVTGYGITHSDGAVQVAFGLTSNHGTTTTWNGASCAASYCHGATLAGGTAKTPVWTLVDGSQKGCASCHGFPPAAPHAQRDDCGTCHTGYSKTGATTGTVDQASHVNGVIDVSATLSCTTCHGTAGLNEAPPKDTAGNSATTFVGVGAHQVHVLSNLSKPIACTECHGAAAAGYGTGHSDGVVQVAFGATARANGATPAWSKATASCAASYCHGGTAATTGGSATTPVWTTVDGSQRACGACHGFPPAAPHSQSNDCGSCHGAGYAKTSATGGTVVPATHVNGTLDLVAMSCTSCHGAPPAAPHVASTDCGHCHTGYTATTINPALHYNGTVDVVALSCTSCHGTAGVNPAPPADTKGLTATSLKSVGAHQAHLGTTLMAPLACTECHGAAAGSYANLHADGTVQVAFGATATHGGAPAAWNGASCAASYCHAQGGSAPAPVWTTVDGSQKSCASCHGFPPAAPHVQSDDCGMCHTGYAKTGATTGTVVQSAHINGTVDVATLTCASCHGDAGRAGLLGAMPPRAVSGATAATARGVGAHEIHMFGGPLATALDCTDCHSIPVSNTHTDGVVNVAFSVKAGVATFNPVDATCTNACHGTGTPRWNDAASGACGSCHGLPPAAPHSQDTNCGMCHGVGYSLTTVNPVTHADGLVQTRTLTCTTCHGGASGNTAPPLDLAGNSATTSKGVGAHQSHLGTQLMQNPLGCADCHGAATAGYAVDHMDGTIQMSFGVLAGTATWNGTTCANACHGAGLSGGTAKTPTWTVVDGSQKTCGSCHGFPPAAPHTAKTTCSTCHVGYGDKVGNTATVNRVKHMDGTVDAPTMTCTSCHGDSAQVATAASPFFATPPTDADGNTAVTARGVGAHQKHVASTTSRPVACSECHAGVASYTTSHADGATPITFGTLGTAPAAAWSGATLNCTATYCHGNFGGGNGAASASPTWTTTAGTTCTTCHGAPPPLPHIQRADCGTCHEGYTVASTNPALHVNGSVDVLDLVTCNFCHNNPIATNDTTTYHHVVNSGPPYFVTAYPLTFQPAVGAADKTCTHCHVGHAQFKKPGSVMRPSVFKDFGQTVATNDDGQICLDCHVYDQAKDTTRQKDDAPAIVNQKTNAWEQSGADNWLNSKALGGHNFTVTGAFQASSAAAGQFNANCVKCHNTSALADYQVGVAPQFYKFTLHQSPDRNLRGALGQTTLTDNNEEQLCYRCHSTTNDAIGGTVKGTTNLDWYGVAPMSTAATNVYAQMQKTGGRHNVGGYSGVHRTNLDEENLAYLAANKHVECSDCHDAHQVRRGNSNYTGTVTTVPTTVTLSDSGAAWATNALVGYQVDVGASITTNTNFYRGQVVSNTTTSLTYTALKTSAGANATAPTQLVGYRVGIRPDGGAVTAISSTATTTTITDAIGLGGVKAWQTDIWKGWWLSIVFGTGSGQTCQVLSNTANTVTVNCVFATPPVTTPAASASRYVISKLPATMGGATGITVTSWGTTTAALAWGATNTVYPAANSTSPIPVAYTQWQVCAKCHSSSNASLTAWNASWTDQSKEFNPNNASYHPVIAMAGTATSAGKGNTQLTATQLSQGWRPGDIMTCSDCHGNDVFSNTAAQGPHASAVKFMLRGPMTRWPTQADGTTRWTYTNRTAGTGANGLFCLNCHVLSSPHTSNHTGYACTACHIRIPHGGKVKRLIATFPNTLTAQGILTTGTPAPYVDTGVTQILRAYGGVATSSSSCNAGCTGGTSTRSGHTLKVGSTNSW